MIFLLSKMILMEHNLGFTTMILLNSSKALAKTFVALDAVMVLIAQHMMIEQTLANIAPILESMPMNTLQCTKKFLLQVML